MNCCLDELPLHHSDFDHVSATCPISPEPVGCFSPVLHEYFCLFSRCRCHDCVRLSSAHLLLASTRCVPAVANQVPLSDRLIFPCFFCQFSLKYQRKKKQRFNVSSLYLFHVTQSSGMRQTPNGVRFLLSGSVISNQVDWSAPT